MKYMIISTAFQDVTKREGVAQRVTPSLTIVDLGTYFTSSKVDNTELQPYISTCSKYDNIMVYSYQCPSIVIYDVLI